MSIAPITLADSCVRFLVQARDLACGIEPEVFATPMGVGHGATIGQHLRHCLDHVDAFLDGLPDGRVDYDQRRRGGAEETDPTAAVNRMERTMQRLQRARLDEGEVLRVKLDCGVGAETWRQSTAGRELQFLISHLVHHFAIVAILCRLQGVELGETFGVAPSTLRYRREV